MWGLPGPEIESVSPALAGGFLTTAPPGKSLISEPLGCLGVSVYSVPHNLGESFFPDN